MGSRLGLDKEFLIRKWVELSFSNCIWVEISFFFLNGKRVVLMGNEFKLAFQNGKWVEFFINRKC